MKVGSYLAEQLAKAGIDTTDAKYKDILAITQELPDDAVTELNNKLFNEDAAKQNPILKKYFHAQALNGMDATLEELLEEFQIETSTREELKKEPSTYKRVPALVKKIKELEEKKASAKFADKKALTDEIDKLNKEIAATKEASDKALKAKDESAAASILSYAIDSFLASKQYASEAPAKVQLLTAKNLLDEDLKSKKIKVIRRDDNTLSLVQAENPDLEYREQNKPVSFADYADKLLGANKLLKVTDPKPGKTPVTPVITGKDKPDVSKVTSAIDAQLEQLKAA